MKENKGITLVALIITIIVMLIIVGVTISAVVNSDIIGQGEEAARAYENKQTEEQNLNFATEDSKTVQNYLDNINENKNKLEFNIHKSAGRRFSHDTQNQTYEVSVFFTPEFTSNCYNSVKESCVQIVNHFNELGIAEASQEEKNVISEAESDDEAQELTLVLMYNRMAGTSITNYEQIVQLAKEQGGITINNYSDFWLMLTGGTYSSAIEVGNWFYEPSSKKLLINNEEVEATWEGNSAHYIFSNDNYEYGTYDVALIIDDCRKETTVDLYVYSVKITFNNFESDSVWQDDPSATIGMRKGVSPATFDEGCSVEINDSVSPKSGYSWPSSIIIDDPNVEYDYDPTNSNYLILRNITKDVNITITAVAD